MATTTYLGAASRSVADHGTRIAIVGAGPIATYAMAHLAALLSSGSTRAAVIIDIFDSSGRLGDGAVHDANQARTSYLNRVAGQIAFAPDESNDVCTALLPIELRPTFLQWSAAAYARTQNPDFHLGAADVPKRYVHGLGLREAFNNYVSLLRSLPNVSVTVHRAEVVDLWRSGTCFVVCTAQGASIAVNRVLFATGHSQHRRELRWPNVIDHPYPLHTRLGCDVVSRGRAVGLRGLGLTAMDVMLWLTEGRGGCFVPVDGYTGALRYIPSGAEPSSIVAVSPSGTPVCGRAHNDKVSDPAAHEHRGVFLTQDAIAVLRDAVGVPAATGSARLDFGADVFPLMVLEMAYLYHRTVAGCEAATRLVHDTQSRYQDFLAGGTPRGEAGADALIAAVPSASRIDWRSVFDPVPLRLAHGGASWHDLVVSHMRRDLANCLQGNLRNPVKAACDGVWRDLRGVIAAAVDDGGLTPTSHRDFTTRYMRYYNRVSNGPGIVALRKVLALAEFGLLDLTIGPNPVVRPEGDGFVLTGPHTATTRHVDVLIEGKTAPFDPAKDVSPLYRNLLRRGLVRIWRNEASADGEDYVPGALDLDHSYHPVTAHGDVDTRLTFLGAPAEGLRTFQLTAARPHSNSPVLNWAAAWAEEIAATAR